jgi:hypothetical protein
MGAGEKKISLQLKVQVPCSPHLRGLIHRSSVVIALLLLHVILASDYCMMDIKYSFMIMNEVLGPIEKF